MRRTVFIISHYPTMLDHKYKVFCQLAQTPNTTKVAEELYLSQPAVSRNIRELEKELGITLFLREKGRLQLTKAGEYLYRSIAPFVKKEREISFEMDRLKEKFCGLLRIGASTTLSQYVLPEILAGFITCQPRIKIELISGNTDQIEKEVLSDSLHLAFIEGTPTQQDLHYIPYLRDEIVLVCSSTRQLPETISQTELRKLRFIFREKGSGTSHIIRKQLSAIGIPMQELQHQLVLGTTEGIKQYLRHSDCCALLSVYSIRNELLNGKLKVIDIDGLKIERTFYAIHRQGEIDPYARKFLEFVLSSRK